MSRRAFLVIAFLAVMTMSGGAGAGVLLGRAEDARQVVAVRPTTAAAPSPAPGGPPSTVPAAAGSPAARPGASPRGATAPAGERAVLTARVARRLPDGLLIWLDASEPLRDGLLHWSAGAGPRHADRIVGTITHGSVELPLGGNAPATGNAPVTVQASGRTADGRLVTSNSVSAPPA